MLQNIRITAFTVSELLREHQQRKGSKNTSTRIRVRFCCHSLHSVFIMTESKHPDVGKYETIKIKILKIFWRTSLGPVFIKFNI